MVVEVLEEKVRKVSKSQFFAIVNSVKIGRILQETLPGIVDDFESGLSQREIVEKYRLDALYSISKITAISAVGFALKGYTPKDEFRDLEEEYDGLINQDRYDELVKEHKSAAHDKENKRRKKKSVGIYGLTEQERKQRGKKSAKTRKKRRTGLAARTHQDCQESGRDGAKACGYTIWSKEEKASAIKMAKQPGKEYRHGSRLAINKIAERLNQEYHGGREVRTARRVGKFLKDYRDGLRD